VGRMKDPTDVNAADMACPAEVGASLAVRSDHWMDHHAWVAQEGTRDRSGEEDTCPRPDGSLQVPVGRRGSSGCGCGCGRPDRHRHYRAYQACWEEAGA
jgi:hypothetical protein